MAGEREGEGEGELTPSIPPTWPIKMQVFLYLLFFLFEPGPACKDRNK